MLSASYFMQQALSDLDLLPWLNLIHYLETTHLWWHLLRLSPGQMPFNFMGYINITLNILINEPQIHNAVKIICSLTSSSARGCSPQAIYALHPFLLHESLSSLTASIVLLFGLLPVFWRFRPQDASTILHTFLFISFTFLNPLLPTCMALFTLLHIL